MGTRTLGAIAAIVAGALLSACAPATSSTPAAETGAAEASAAVTTTQSELPPGFYLGEEFVEIGEFNPEEVELVNLCGEIPDEVLLEAGMVNTGSDARFHPDSIICTHEESGEGKGLFGLISDPITKAVLTSEELLWEGTFSSSVPGSFLYSFPSDEASCFAAIETNRGLVSVVYDNPFINTDQEKICDRALGALESIYIQLRGK